MPLLSKREFNRHVSVSQWKDLREAGDLCTYRNELNELARNLTKHYPPEVKFFGGDSESAYDGSFMRPKEIFDQQILLYDARNTFKTLPFREAFHDWALVFDGTPIFN